MKKLHKCKLLPYTREDIHGFSRDSGQMLGWQITSFNIDNIWKKYTGKDITIAIIDTGCDSNHEDLKSNIIEGHNFLNDTTNFEDDNGHGTHVAGIIAAANNRAGMVGVAPETKIIPIKALDEKGSGDNENIAKAIVWAADQSCDIITMSIGSASDTPSLRRAIDYAVKKNILIFCAAGNYGDSSPIMYPAKYESTIAIGSINERGERSQFNCTGEEIDFLSPGENIFSCVQNNKYAMMSGTSMANPFAAGCAALYLDFCKQNNITKPKTSRDFINIFEPKAIKLTKINNKKYIGNGIINPVGILLN